VAHDESLEGIALVEARPRERNYWRRRGSFGLEQGCGGGHGVRAGSEQLKGYLDRTADDAAEGLGNKGTKLGGKPLSGKVVGGPDNEEAIVEEDADGILEPCFVIGTCHLQLELSQGYLPQVLSTCLRPRDSRLVHVRFPLGGHREHKRRFSADGGTIAGQHEGIKSFMTSTQENVNPFGSLKLPELCAARLAGVFIWGL